MKKQLSVFFLSSVILLSGCSASGGPSAVDENQFSNKMDELTYRQDKEETSDGEKIAEVEPPETKFWPEMSRYKMEKAKVTAVASDGTIEVNSNERVMLLGIRITEDEKGGRTYHKMFPKEAQAFLEKKLINKTVYLEVNPEFKISPEGETPAYVWVGDSEELQNINALLLKEGLAVTDRLENVSFYDQSFKKIENEANDLKIGLWATAER